MFDVDKWQEIFHVLKSNKLRTFLTAFGVFWGIFMLVIMLGCGNGLRNGIMYWFEGFATNSAFFWGNSTTISYNGLQRGRHIVFDNNDVSAIRQQVKGIKIITPRTYVSTWRSGDSANIVVYNNKRSAFSINGDLPEQRFFEEIKLEGGRFINEIDIRQNRKVAIIGSRVKEVLFKKDEAPLGKYIKIGSIYYQVVGVLSASKNGDRGGNESITIPLTTLQKAYGLGNDIDHFSVTAIDEIPVGDLEKQILDIIKKRHNIAPTDEQAIGHFNIYDFFKRLLYLFIGINTLIWVVGIGTLLSGVIGVSNIMLIVVKERTKEIGIRRAIGAKPSVIINQIITESLFLTIFSGMLGMSLGVFIMESINKSLQNAPAETPFRNPGVDFQIALIALIILILSGIFAGMYPAKKAIDVKPIEALRFE